MYAIVDIAGQQFKVEAGKKSSFTAWRLKWVLPLTLKKYY